MPFSNHFKVFLQLSILLSVLATVVINLASPGMYYALGVWVLWTLKDKDKAAVTQKTKQVIHSIWNRITGSDVH